MTESDRERIESRPSPYDLNAVAKIIRRRKKKIVFERSNDPYNCGVVPKLKYE